MIDCRGNVLVELFTDFQLLFEVLLTKLLAETRVLRHLSLVLTRQPRFIQILRKSKPRIIQELVEFVHHVDARNVEICLPCVLSFILNLLDLFFHLIGLNCLTFLHLLKLSFSSGSRLGFDALHLGFYNSLLLQHLLVYLVEAGGVLTDGVSNKVFLIGGTNESLLFLEHAGLLGYQALDVALRAIGLIFEVLIQSIMRLFLHLK
mmetsp:Transcript_31022/g.49760  ORF Transcript_31022/g.49760 Transcript_31022/m.49760 type:complete len:205 (+) Transcript_31022:2813-3427(+)